MNTPHIGRNFLNCLLAIITANTLCLATLQAAEISSDTNSLPRLVDLGADKCIPCKMMAPILRELNTELAGRVRVEFIDVWKNPAAAKTHGIKLIPTQIFYGTGGKELYRHEGFLGKKDILAKWRELGVDLTVTDQSGFVREIPAEPAPRPQAQICFMCGGKVNAPDRVLVKGQKEQRILCSPHCYFIFYSSLTKPDEPLELGEVLVTDASGREIPARSALYWRGQDKSGRTTIRAFASKEAATQTQQAEPGNLVSWDELKAAELATRCGFCDRAVYPQDAISVKAGEQSLRGCCPMCALGVAARLQKDIAVEAKDALTGEILKVKTAGGTVASLEPKTMVAWAGEKKGPDGHRVSAGCFHQAWFANAANLVKWAGLHPLATGRQITIEAALAEKMSLTREQIGQACKLDKCP
jgi:thioredoxin 1